VAALASNLLRLQILSPFTPPVLLLQYLTTRRRYLEQNRIGEKRKERHSKVGTIAQPTLDRSHRLAL